MIRFKNTGNTPDYYEKLRETDAKNSEVKNEVFGIKLPLEKGTNSNNKLFKMCSSLEENIKNNITTFLMCRKGEKLGQGSFGTMLHEYYNKEDADNIYEEAASSVINDLQTYFPLINVKEYVAEKIDATDDNPSHFKIHITYIVGNSDKRTTVTVNIKTAG